MLLSLAPLAEGLGFDPFWHLLAQLSPARDMRDERCKISPPLSLRVIARYRRIGPDFPFPPSAMCVEKVESGGVVTTVRYILLSCPHLHSPLFFLFCCRDESFMMC